MRHINSIKHLASTRNTPDTLVSIFLVPLPCLLFEHLVRLTWILKEASISHSCCYEFSSRRGWEVQPTANLDSWGGKDLQLHSTLHSLTSLQVCDVPTLFAGRQNLSAVDYDTSDYVAPQLRRWICWIWSLQFFHFSRRFWWLSSCAAWKAWYFVMWGTKARGRRRARGSGGSRCFNLQ